MKTFTKLLILATTLAAAYGGWKWWVAQQPEPLPEGIVSANGRVEAVQVDVATKMAGRIEEVLAREGDLVHADQVIARMDTRQLKASLAQAEARLAEVRQSVEQAKAVITKTESDVALAQKQVDRNEKLLERMAVSESVFDTAVNTLAVAQATLGANKAALRTQEFAVKAAEAGVLEIETQIADAVLISPTRGRVLYRLAEKGEVLPAGGKVMTILDLTDIYMEFYLPSRYATETSLHAEARVVFDIDSESGYSEPATVSFVSPEAQFTPKQVETAEERDKLMFRVKVRFEPERVEPYLEYVKTGVRAVAYVRLDPSAQWPEFLSNLYPDDPADLFEETSNPTDKR